MLLGGGGVYAQGVPLEHAAELAQESDRQVDLVVQVHVFEGAALRPVVPGSQDRIHETSQNTIHCTHVRANGGSGRTGFHWIPAGHISTHRTPSQ